MLADYWHNTLLIWKLTKRWEREEHVVCQTSSTVMIYWRETSCFSGYTRFLWFGNKQTLNSPHLSSLEPVNKPVYMTDRRPGEFLHINKRMIIITHLVSPWWKLTKYIYSSTELLRHITFISGHQMLKCIPEQWSLARQLSCFGFISTSCEWVSVFVTTKASEKSSNIS